ncbi:MAG: hypothetical protein JXA96_00925 [Sedimentisphaerales bacterium]|nr:hypothetical protein [Sedimentisphaerales bacterium]
MKNCFVRASFSVFILLIVTTSAFPQWIQTNWLENNDYFNLIAGEDVVFARIWDSNDGGRVFFSDDDGANWAQISSAGSDIDILSIAMLDNTILAGTWEGFYTSTLNDMSWEPLEPTGISEGMPVCSIAMIGDTLFAGGMGEIYKSSKDDINNWTEVSDGIPADTRILFIVSNGKAIFAGSEDKGIFISTDSGINWTQINSGLADTNISQLEVVGTKVFAVTLDAGVFVSDVNDAKLASGIANISWAADTSSPENINCLFYNNLLFAGTDSNGVYRSADRGQTWIETNSGMPDDTRIWSMTLSNDSIMAGTGDGIMLLSMEDMNSYTITASASEGGTISPEGDVTVYENFAQTFTFTPALGYKINDVLVDGSSVGIVDSYEFINITADHTISVEFQAVPIYTITSSAQEGGTISPLGTVQVSESWSQEYKMTPLPGYVVDSVVIDGNDVGDILSYTFTNVTANHTISVSFKDAPYIITASAGIGGTISPSGSVEVWKGLSQKFTIVPSDGYEITDVVVDGVSYGSLTSYTFSSISTNHTISASFSSKFVYQINCGGGQSSTFAPDLYYNAGSTYSVTDIPINTNEVTNPAPQDVYQTERYGNFTYTFPGLIPEMPYKVRLHFAEIYSGSYGIGVRVFNVYINGTKILSNYDIYAETYSLGKVLIKDFIFSANASGEIAIQFETIADNAKISAIEIIKQ